MVLLSHTHTKRTLQQVQSVDNHCLRQLTSRACFSFSAKSLKRCHWSIGFKQPRHCTRLRSHQHFEPRALLVQVMEDFLPQLIDSLVREIADTEHSMTNRSSHHFVVKKHVCCHIGMSEDQEVLAIFAFRFTNSFHVLFDGSTLSSSRIDDDAIHAVDSSHEQRVGQVEDWLASKVC